MSSVIHNPIPTPEEKRCMIPTGISGSKIGGSVTRKRYQRGALRREGTLWILRWREDILNENGTVSRVERRARVGMVKDLPTKALARRVADRMVEHVNALDYQPGMVTTMEQFAEIYARDAAPNFTPSARLTVESVSRTLIVPTLGKFRLDEITGRVPQLDRKSVV